MSLVFSIASHSALQYFSFVMQEQTGCAHFFPSVAMFLLYVYAIKVLALGPADEPADERDQEQHEK
jgi:hypothetical protein